MLISTNYTELLILPDVAMYIQYNALGTVIILAILLTNVLIAVD